MEKDCIFCKIIKGEVPSHKIYEDQKTYAFLDIACDYEGHILVVPKQHCTNILDCSNPNLAAVVKSVKKISKHLVNNCGYNGVNVLNANNAAAEQSVFHLHFHIIPRKNSDNFKTWPNQSKQNFDLADIANKLKL